MRTTITRLAHTACFYAFAGLVLASCQSTPPPAAAPQPPVPAATEVAPPAVPADTSFAAWLDGLRKEAIRRGVRPETVALATANLAPLPQIVELDRHQPESTQTFWRYFSGAVTPSRIATGKALLEKHAALLANLERKYGVQGRFLVAYWALESDFSRLQGNYSVIAATATLAYDARRSAMFREELIDALIILDRGNVSLERMKGSWAGAMGSTQFMPSNYLRYAVDEDSDGRIDIWDSVPDTLGSAANFLKSLGWNDTRTWGREVTLPAGLDLNLASLDNDAKETIKSLKEWRALGVRRAEGGPLPDQDVAASLVLPQGAKGPAFLVYDNFRVILKFNHSIFYALTIAHLADRFAGAPPLIASKINDPPLKRDDVMALQNELAQLGFLKDEPDGTIGTRTRQAVRAFQRVNNLPPDGYADAQLIARVHERAVATIAPGIASPREIAP